MPTTAAHPQATELRSLLRRLAAADIRPAAVHDGEELVVTRTQTEAAEAILSVDECSVRLVRHGEKVGTLYLVMGNSAGEIVCDHTDSPILTPLMDGHADEWMA